MNKFKLYAASLLITGLAAGCAKSVEPENQHPQQIVLCVGDDTIDMDVQTKATAITEIPSSLNFSVTTGKLGSSETTKKASASVSPASGKIATGLYQTANATSYNYYVSNCPITFAASGSTVSASNATDVIAGTATSSSTSPSVTLDHIFARTGTLTLNTQTGYALSKVSWSIDSSTGGTAGTYNIATKAWSKLTALASTSITGSSDMYLVPGNYTLTVNYTLTKGDWTKSFTKSAVVTLVGGKINNISGTASGGAASEISLSVSLTQWGSTDITADFK